MNTNKYSLKKRVVLIVLSLFLAWFALFLTSCLWVIPPKGRDNVIESKIYRPDLLVQHDCSLANTIKEHYYVKSIEHPVISEATRLGEDERRSEKYLVADYGSIPVSDPFFKNWVGRGSKTIDPNCPMIKYVGMSADHKRAIPFPFFFPYLNRHFKPRIGGTFLDPGFCRYFRCDIYSDETLVMTFKVDYNHRGARATFEEVVRTYLAFALVSKKDFKIKVKHDERLETKRLDIAGKVYFLKEHFLGVPQDNFYKRINKNMTLEQALDVENIYEE